jgi:hypothetical protein
MGQFPLNAPFKPTRHLNAAGVRHHGAAATLAL